MHLHLLVISIQFELIVFFLLLSFKFFIRLKNIALIWEFWVCMSLSYVSVANFKASRIDNFYTFTFHTFTLSHFYSFTLSSVSHFPFPWVIQDDPQDSCRISRCESERRTVQVLPRTVQDVGTPIDLFPTILSRAAAVRQRASLSLSSFFSSKPLRAFCSQIILTWNIWWLLGFKDFKIFDDF